MEKPRSEPRSTFGLALERFPFGSEMESVSSSGNSGDAEKSWVRLKRCIMVIVDDCLTIVVVEVVAGGVGEIYEGQWS